MNCDEAVKSASVALLEFYASWCPHCQRMMPVVDQVKKEVAGKAAVYQYDIDKDQNEANAHGVESIPTFILYKDGKEVWRQSGEMSAADLVAMIESA